MAKNSQQRQVCLGVQRTGAGPWHVDRSRCRAQATGLHIASVDLVLRLVKGRRIVAVHGESLRLGASLHGSNTTPAAPKDDSGYGESTKEGADGETLKAGRRIVVAGIVRRPLARLAPARSRQVDGMTTVIRSGRAPFAFATGLARGPIENHLTRPIRDDCIGARHCNSRIQWSGRGHFCEAERHHTKEQRQQGDACGLLVRRHEKGANKAATKKGDTRARKPKPGLFPCRYAAKKKYEGLTRRAQGQRGESEKKKRKKEKAKVH